MYIRRCHPLRHLNLHLPHLRRRSTFRHFLRSRPLLEPLLYRITNLLKCQFLKEICVYSAAKTAQTRTNNKMLQNANKTISPTERSKAGLI